MATPSAILLSAFLFLQTLLFHVVLTKSVDFSREQVQLSGAKICHATVFAQDDCTRDPDATETIYLAAAAAALFGSHQIVTLIAPGVLPITTN